MRTIRLTARDHAELVAYLTPYFKKKRGMFQKGHVPVVSLSSEPIDALPEVIVRVTDKANGKKPVVKTPTKKSRKKWGDVESTRKMKLELLGLSTKVYNAVTNAKRFKIKTIGDLHGVIDDLYMIPNFGTKSIKECRDKLAAAGLID
jgi:hypothetical protein